MVYNPQATQKIFPETAVSAYYGNHQCSAQCSNVYIYSVKPMSTCTYKLILKVHTTYKCVCQYAHTWKQSSGCPHTLILSQTMPMSKDGMYMYCTTHVLYTYPYTYMYAHVHSDVRVCTLDTIRGKSTETKVSLSPDSTHTSQLLISL